jgi:hypothetical protein
MKKVDDGVKTFWLIESTMFYKKRKKDQIELKIAHQLFRLSLFY